MRDHSLSSTGRCGALARLAFAAMLAGILNTALSRAVLADSSPPASADQAASASASSHDGDFWTRDALTGNWGGRRSALEDEGILLGADTIDEAFGAASGGTSQGSVYEGRLELLATLNLEKLIDWAGATFHANAYQIHGRGLSRNDLGGNLMTISNIEATGSFRLFDLWVEQLFYDGKLSIRAGQIAADDEFFASQYASNFINSTFGWPAIMGADLPNSGPVYPMPTPGLRVTVAATDQLALSLAVINGDPAGGGTGDPQLRNPSGTAFRLNDGAFAIGEASYAADPDKDALGLPATYKAGFWFHSGRFADQRFDKTELSLAAPGSTGAASSHQNDFGAYALADWMVWKDPKIDGRNIGAFLRVAGAPDDRNLIALYADAGVNFKGVFPNRLNDILGVGFAFAQISQKARALDADARDFSGLGTPIRDSESAIEVMYHYQLTPWWSLQPDLQFIRHPGGGVGLPNNAVKAIPNAVVIGLRSAVLF